MIHLTRHMLPALAAAAVLLPLTGCTSDDAPDRSSAPPRPLTTSTAAPDAAEQLAERYRRAGGVKEVYGIAREPGPDGVPRLVVWRNDRNDDGEAFDRVNWSVVNFLEREDGRPLDQGYLLDVYGPDGKPLNSLDARP